jgi:DNA-binding cell septation regulator SpoVG
MRVTEVRIRKVNQDGNRMKAVCSVTFVIKAIGDPDRMIRVMEDDTSQYNILKMAGYPVHLEKHRKISVESYKGGYQFSYAQPKEDQ